MPPSGWRVARRPSACRVNMSKAYYIPMIIIFLFTMLSTALHLILPVLTYSLINK